MNKSLWTKWWFFVPISFLILFFIFAFIGYFFKLDPEAIITLMYLVWISSIITWYASQR